MNNNICQLLQHHIAVLDMIEKRSNHFGRFLSLSKIPVEDISESLTGSGYVITKDIIDTLMSGLDTLPDNISIDQTGLPPAPTKTGFAYLEKPIILRAPTEDVKIHSFSWVCHSDDILVLVYEDRFSKLYGFGRMLVRYDQTLNEIVNDPYDPQDTWGDVDDRTAEDIKQYIKFIWSLFPFMQQKMIYQDKETVPRSFRKMYHRGQRQAPFVTTITLRRKEYCSKSTSDNSIDYTCRWIVQGHWRHQWYKQSKNHKLIWIDSFVKGPNDKPLLIKNKPVFVVSR